MKLTEMKLKTKANSLINNKKLSDILPFNFQINYKQNEVYLHQSCEQVFENVCIKWFTYLICIPSMTLCGEVVRPR